MATLRLANSYRPLPQQDAFRRSTARFRAFGGAMGGGKSRALCEEVYDWMLDMPGIHIAVVRQLHTALVETTRKTFYDQVLPAELQARKDLCRIVKSQGEDSCTLLWNNSKVSFYGLDNPGRFFSAEYGAACFDEAHEITERDVLTVNTRLRQRCPRCTKNAASYSDPQDAPDCDHFPHSIILTFNPSHPGHWLRNWFILGSVPTEWGFRKEALIPKGADRTVGDAEFFISRATENPHLPKRYVDQNLGGMSEKDRRRYLEGYWEYTDESGFFDADALARLTANAGSIPPVFVGRAQGDPTGEDPDKKPSLVEHKTGQLHVWKPPQRYEVNNVTGEEIKPHRYVIGVDASSGTSSDYSAIQVVCVETLEQVAEWQGMVDPDKLAEQAFLIGTVYNGALLVPEITGGWGFAVTKRLQALIGKWKGPTQSKPRLYTKKRVEQLSNKWTDFLGWDTTTKSRAQMLDTLEQSLRDGSLEVYGLRTLSELAAFTSVQNQQTGEYRNPRAAMGEHDDLVVALAIATHIASTLPRQVREMRQPAYEPMFSATGF
jgi:hypothetical protein